MHFRYDYLIVGRLLKSEAWQIVGWPVKRYCGPIVSLALHLELGLVYARSIASARVSFRVRGWLFQMRRC